MRQRRQESDSRALGNRNKAYIKPLTLYEAGGFLLWMFATIFYIIIDIDRTGFRISFRDIRLLISSAVIILNLKWEKQKAYDIIGYELKKEKEGTASFKVLKTL